MKKTIQNAIAICTCFLIALTALPWVYSESYTLSQISLTPTSTDGAAHSNLKDFKASVADYPFFEKYCFKPYANTKEQGTYVIPGILYTQSVNENDKPSCCGNMIPQGLCATKEYLIVSAYCHDGEHHSVLYLIDKKTHEYVKTVVLSGFDHCGSVAYDPNDDMVWVSTGKTNAASMSGISLKKIVGYRFNDTLKPIKFDKVLPMGAIVRNSFMTYYNNSVYASTFSQASTVNPLLKVVLNDNEVQNGIIKESDEETLDTNSLATKKDEVPHFSAIGTLAQGIAIDKDLTFVSFSYGPYVTSQLCIFKTGTSQLYPINAIKSYELPECLEQIWIDNGKLYMLFESAGWPFRNDTIHHMDRIVTADINMLVNS